MSTQPTLTTQRLTLRPFTLADAPQVTRLAGDPILASTVLNIPHPYQPGMAEQWIAKHRDRYANGESAVFAITLTADTKLLGAIGIVIERRHDRAEMGYWIGREYWNHGYATEAGRAVTDFGFQHLKLNKLNAHHFLRNPASGRVMQKMGYKREGIAWQQVRKNDGYEDIVMYGLTRSDWQTTCNPPPNPG